MTSRVSDQQSDYFEAMDALCSLPVIAEVLLRLETELSPTLTYHTVEHARDVLGETVMFARAEGVSGEDLEDLAIAAAYHDAGFLEADGDNEEVAAQIAEQAMLAHGYEQRRIDRVRVMILDTQLVETPIGRVQQPHESLSRYLLDGDLSNLGREDFFDKLALLQKESRPEGKPSLEVTHKLLTTHEWFTDSARAMREQQKVANRRKLEEMMSREGSALHK